MTVLSAGFRIANGILNGQMRPILNTLKQPSYSQFGEDVALLRQANFSEPGYYVDVGACYPVRYSNTFLYYVRGWRGLLIEPNPDLSDRLRRVRPRDTVVPMGISQSGAKLSYRKFDDAEFNSFNDGQVTALAEYGIKSAAALEIQTAPLRDILAANNVPSDFELLSVDCEGMDVEVLESNDWDKFRPRWIIVEDYQNYQGDSTEDSAIAKLLQSVGYTVRIRLGFSYIYCLKDLQH
jgi:FkbM family methyltransferase